MVNIDKHLKKGKISRIKEFEFERYRNFLGSSYKNNLRHSKANLTTFPGWSIISGYYAMHDIAKMFLAIKFKIKVERDVHETTIKIFNEIIKDKELFRMIRAGYHEFISLAQDLEEAKRERVKVQYYTNTKYLYKEYKKRAEDFFNGISLAFVIKIEGLLK